MASKLIVSIIFLAAKVRAQEIETCYGTGSIIGAIIGTLLITIALLASSFLIYKMYWRSRKGKHLLVTDPETAADQYAFDNPCFREATPIKQGFHDDTKPVTKSDKSKWLAWSPLQALVGQKNEKVKSLDDSYVNNSHMNVVSLKSHDFTGLGFSICGNMRDGIFIKEVLHRGPAHESGRINAGDRIDSVCISFRHMVFEDALTILSYASPYEVQVQVENNVSSKPSTLLRHKKETVISPSERICHPFYRSQSIADLAEIEKPNNKRNHLGFTTEKNFINSSNHSRQDLPPYHGSPSNYPTLKLTPSPNQSVHKIETKETPKRGKENVTTQKTEANTSRVNYPSPSSETKTQNKLHKFGIKVLPISPKMGTQSLKSESPDYNARSTDKINTSQNDNDETDSPLKENVRNMFSKGILNLKEKINQNNLVKRKPKTSESSSNDEGDKSQEKQKPIPKARSNIQPKESEMDVPEEVTRAGNAARNNRKSTASISSQELLSESKSNGVVSLENISNVKSIAKNYDLENQTKSETGSCSDVSSDRDNDTTHSKPKRNKGKAPPPPNKINDNKIETGVDDIKQEGDIAAGKNYIFEPTKLHEEKSNTENDTSITHISSKSDIYDSDSDIEIGSPEEEHFSRGTKIELNATQVTIHQSPPFEVQNSEEVESRKAASLGDLSKLESEQPLTVVLERAVSLDMANGATQNGKKRKAPLPPPEEFPAVFDNEGYRKEPRLDGLNTFQRKLRKASEFGTLEDALQDEPVEGDSTEMIEETHISNIREFSSWLEECRKNKDEMFDESQPPPFPGELNQNKPADIPPKVVFSINGKDPNSDVTTENTVANFPGINSRTVLVISQPNSLELLPNPVQFEIVSQEEITTQDLSVPVDCDTSTEAYITAVESKLEPSYVTSVEESEDEMPPKLPTSPMPTVDTSILSPLSSSLTYITEIKVTSTDTEDTPTLTTVTVNNLDVSQTSPESHINGNLEARKEEKCLEKTQIVHSTPVTTNKTHKNKEFQLDESIISCEKTVTPFKISSHIINSPDVPLKKPSESDSSKIPIRTMKSETGQKVLATIQSLTEKSLNESPTYTESDQVKRVASLFSAIQTSPKNIKKDEKNNGNVASFYLRNENDSKKSPPAVPPRKTDITHIVMPDSEVDRKITSFQSFTPAIKRNDQDHRVVSRLASWSDSLNKDGVLNGDHDIQVQTGVVNLPVKTSATKIVFENKVLDSEEL